MKERTSQALFGYWNEVRGSRLAPRRFEIEPSRITNILPETFILERQERRQYVFRLAGTRVCEQFGREFRNLDILNLWTPDDAEVVARLLDSVAYDGAAAVATVEAGASPRRSVTFEMLFLPLVHNGTEITRILGCLCTSQTPTWLGLEPLTRLKIDGFHLVWPDGRPYAVIAAGEQQAPFSPAQVPSRTVRSERRQFRVYEGGLGAGSNDP
jgi:hypothetical protein